MRRTHLCLAAASRYQFIVRSAFDHPATGCEGRISVAQRRHGLNRCQYQGVEEMKRSVGLGGLADNLINMVRRCGGWCPTPEPSGQI
jgi:hypothetical protein